MGYALHSLCRKCCHRLHLDLHGAAHCPHCILAHNAALQGPQAPDKPGHKAGGRVQGTSQQATFRHTVAGALVKADYDRLMMVRGQMGVSTSQIVTLIVLAHLDKLDLAAKYPYSGCPSSAQKAERALRAEAEGAGHAAYHGANGDGKGHGE